MKNYPKVAIIFPVHNGWEDTKKCLESISDLNYPKSELTVIIIDNASFDGTPEKVKQFAQKHSHPFLPAGRHGVCLPSKAFKKESERGRPIRKNSHKPTIKLITNRVNLGFGRAVNQGGKKAKSEFVLITNNDVIFEKDCLKQLVKTSTSEPKVGVVGGRVYWQNKKKLCIDGFRLNPFLAYHQFDLSGQNQKRECDWISGNCFFIKRKLFLKLGGFDKDYFFYFEDVDLCLRVKKAGLKLLYNPKAIAYHRYGRTIFKERTDKIFYLGYRSRWHCVFKNALPLQIFTSSLFLLALAPLYPSLKTRHNLYKPMIRGLIDNLSKGQILNF